MKELKVFEGSMMYLVIGILFISVSLLLSSMDTAIEIQLLITQYFIIGLPPILYLWIKHKPIRSTLRLRRISLKTILAVIGITLLIYPIAVLMNTVIMLILSLFGTIQVPQVPTATSSNQYFLYLMIIAFSAGICEEVLFRGFIMRSFENVGYKFAIVFSGLLFGIFHFNIYNLGATFFFGILFGYLIVLTDSLWAGVIGHITNNALAVSLGFFTNQMQELSQEMFEGGELANPEAITSSEILMAIALFGFIALGTGFGALILLNYLRKKYRVRDSLIMNKERKSLQSESGNEGIHGPTDKDYHLKEFWPIILVLVMFVVLTGFQLYEVISGATL